MKCEKCFRELYEPMLRRMPGCEGRGKAPASFPVREPYPLSHSCLAEEDLRDVVFDLSTRFGLIIAVHGQGSPDDCFAEVCRVAPAFGRSRAAAVGLGFINGDLAFPWSMLTGGTGSALLFFGHPDADSDWSFDHVLMPLLRELHDPWQASMRTLDGTWHGQAGTIINEDSEVLPLWKLQALAHTTRIMRPRSLGCVNEFRPDPVEAG